MNVFQQSYEIRLQSLYDLRSRLINLDTQDKCILIDQWWQKAPLVNHYLHPHELQIWPGPWDLLVENNYCNIARGLGMIYTLLLTGISDIDFSIGIDDNNEDVALVLVDCAKYVMNYYPDTVVNNNLRDFEIKKKIDLSEIKKKI